MIDYGNLQKSLKLLEVQNEQLKTLFSDQPDRVVEADRFSSQPDWIIEATGESVIRRFRICWDCLWKVLGRYLREEILLPKVPHGAKPVIRAAGANALLPSPAEQWIQYAQVRFNIAHDYNGEKAEAALEIMDEFVDDAIGLYQTMSGEVWE